MGHPDRLGGCSGVSIHPNSPQTIFVKFGADSGNFWEFEALCSAGQALPPKLQPQMVPSHQTLKQNHFDTLLT